MHHRDEVELETLTRIDRVLSTTHVRTSGDARAWVRARLRQALTVLEREGMSVSGSVDLNCSATLAGELGDGFEAGGCWVSVVPLGSMNAWWDDDTFSLTIGVEETVLDVFGYRIPPDLSAEALETFLILWQVDLRDVSESLTLARAL